MDVARRKNTTCASSGATAGAGRYTAPLRELVADTATGTAMFIGSEGGGIGGRGTYDVTATGPQPATSVEAASTQRPARRRGWKERNLDKDMACFERLHKKGSHLTKRRKSGPAGKRPALRERSTLGKTTEAGHRTNPKAMRDGVGPR
ncbi:hypothetical protein VHAB30_26850 [Variovorax boronicumulans]|nr:hypothetical protein VHAB30_26850 [Variovorax boronicumulans]